MKDFFLLRVETFELKLVIGSVITFTLQDRLPLRPISFASNTAILLDTDTPVEI